MTISIVEHERGVGQTLLLYPFNNKEFFNFLIHSAKIIGKLYFENPTSGVSRASQCTVIKQAKTNQSESLLE